MPKTRRVVQWSSGGCGVLAVGAIARRRDLDLVGLWVHDPAKAGQDAGELSGVGALGVAATTDADALLALAPDCVSYTAIGESRPEECVADLCRLLEAGCNVVSTSMPGLVYPRAYDAAIVGRLEAAARRGGSTLYMSGIEPGFAADHLVLMLTTISSRIESIRSQEIMTYSHYPVTFTMFDVMGFGRPLDQPCIMEQPGMQRSVWAAGLEMVADQLGIELETIRETYHKAPAPRRLEVASGVIEEGTCGGVRCETIGVVDGRDAIVIEHVNRMALDVAPEWPSAAQDGIYRIDIRGEPDILCDLAVGNEETFPHYCMLATTMRIVNAIPYVCDAEPGVLSATDLPITTPIGAFD